MVVDSRSSAAETASRSPSPHSARTSIAGRPFFMVMGASHASRAPAANSASSKGSHSSGFMSSTLASISTITSAASGEA